MKTIDCARISEWLDACRDLVVDYQSELTQIPALSPVNGGQGEAIKAKKLIEILQNIGMTHIEEIHAPDDRVNCGYRPSIIATLEGQSSEKTIWIMAHTDVVPAGDLTQWQTDPFKAIVEGDKIYGRGTEDNQQGIVSALLAVQACLTCNIVPNYRVGLAFVADEENGSAYGIDYVLKNRPDLFKPQDLIIIPDVGNEDGSMIEIAEKSILWIQCEIIGKQTHGSTPELGVNARKVASYLTVKLDSLYQKYNASDASFDPPISTFEPTKIEANIENVNTIPGRDVFYFDCRILPSYSLDEIKAVIRSWADELESEFGAKINLSFPQSVTAPKPTPPEAPVALAIKEAVRHVLQREAKPIGIGGGTVAAFFREHDLPVVGWCTLDETLHGPNEYTTITNTINDAKVFAHIFLNS